MSVELEPTVARPSDVLDNDQPQYRALSSGAVAALVLGLLSLVALCDYWLVVVPLAGVVWSVVALRQVRARRSELTGIPLAWAGLLLSAVMIPAGPAAVYYQEVSPVPPGYEMIGYDELQPSTKVVGELVPKSALDLNGKKVYIKGYVFSGSDNTGIRKFLLVRDAGTCCFGGNPKITDRIVVSLGNATGMMYTKQIARVAGVFRVSPSQAPNGVGAVYYHLDNAELR
jgi:hypothetical protein